MSKTADPIRKITLADGSTRYRFVIDVGIKVRTDRDGMPVLDASGNPRTMRDQRTHTFLTLKEARAERARIMSERDKGTYVAPSKATLAEFLDEWLAGKRKLRPGTLRTYQGNLATVRERLGHVALTDLREGHISALVTFMSEQGRRAGGQRGTALTGATVNRTLTVLSGALDLAVKTNRIARNPVHLVERLYHEAPELSTWTSAQAARFLASLDGHRLRAGMLLSTYGLRRGEVLGLRWEDVDLAAGTLTIRKTRTAGDPDGAPKSRRSKRTLPIDAELISALQDLQLSQRSLIEQFGPGYGATGHVILDEKGQPYGLDRFSDNFVALARKANVPVIRLHDARHTCATLLHLRGVPVAMISKWLGHATAAFTLTRYVHDQDEALPAVASAIREVYTSVPAQPVRFS